MATTTTNFGWDIPQSTDLVKDGATAIAALGQDIDTALVDLKGGTTGQVLAKATGTDLDFSWVTQDDANAIQNTQLTAKGALISAVSAGTPATLTVGTNNQVLTADSTTATGLKWAAAGGGSLVYVGGASFSGSSSQSLNSVFTSTYQNYMVVLNIALSGASNIYFRFRASGTDNTSSTYQSFASFDDLNSAAAGTSKVFNGTALLGPDMVETALNMTFANPQASLDTYVSCEDFIFGYTSTGAYKSQFAGKFDNTTSFDGFTFYPGAGTMTGNVRVYGIANS
jgi:hypothetical protein